MKKIKLLLILFMGIALSVATSCNKDDDNNDDNGGGGGNPTTKTCYINKQSFEDGSYDKITYYSDHKAKTYEEYDSTGALDSRAEISYNSDGTLAELHQFDDADKEVMKLVYSYSGGKISEIEMFLDMGNGLKSFGVYEYTFSGEHVTKVEMKMDILGTGTPIVASKTEFTYTGDNPTKVVEYEFDAATMGLKKTGEVEYVYDDKKNPFFNIGINFVFPDVQFFAKNNYTKMTVKDDAGAVDQDESANITYEYNENGYPTKSTATNFSGSDSEVTVMEYDCI